MPDRFAFAPRMRLAPQPRAALVNSNENLGESARVCDPLGAPGRSLKWIGEVLCLVRYFFVSKLHDTYGKGTFARVIDLVLGNPKIAFSHDPPDGEVRRPARMVGTQRLQIVATVN